MAGGEATRRRKGQPALLGQGSQFRRVIVPVFPNRLLDRTLIYTALTRATEQVVLLGDREACRAAIQAEPASHRRLTGMAQEG